MAGGSKAAVYAAIGGNSLVMVAKFVGFGLTGSGAMLSEAIHSLADVGNQVLLAVGMRNSQRVPDAEHPFGYGRDAFVWSLMSAVGIFFLGCGVSMAHGVHSLLDPREGPFHAGGLALGILAFSFLVEGTSLAIAIKALWDEAGRRGVGLIENVRTTEDPFGVAVLLEDSAAVLGVVLASGAIWLAGVTHDPRWDAYGTLAVGLLLGLVALFLVAKNRRMLLGRAIPAADQRRLTELLEQDPAVERIAINRAVVA
ncbi:MAG TPA: cation diffusion facilitator family transporter, partial [Deltaproteobacteria bacterium]|nr:cation diffusion facilitator family transporter [Deltaproteobacteria bacterium]